MYIFIFKKIKTETETEPETETEVGAHLGHGRCPVDECPIAVAE